MSSGSRGPPMGRYGSDHDYKRRKNFYASSTRRDFKSSASLTGSASGPGLSLLTQSKPPVRTEKFGSGEYNSRPRLRDSASSGGASSSGSRSNSYVKDARYGYGNKLYSSYSQGYYHERSGDRDNGGDRNPASAAYGSFHSSKRDADYQGYPSNSRDSTSRDMVNGAPSRGEPGLSSRDSWRTERPKINSTGSSKLYASGRYNPNVIPVNGRSGLNSLVSSVSGDGRKDRIDSYSDDTYGSRWKLNYPSSRPEKSGRSRSSQTGGRSHSSKERIRSSGLTNSLGSSKRGESYYPPKQYPGPSNRYTDRYSGGKDYKSSGERGENYDESRWENSYSPGAEDYKYADGAKDNDNDNDSRDASMDTYDDELPRVSRDAEDDAENDDVLDDDDDDDEGEDADEDDEDDEGEDDIDDSKLEINGPSAKVDEQIDVQIHKLDASSVEVNLNVKIDPSPHAATNEKRASVDMNGAVDYPDGCNFPLNEVESQFNEISKEFKALKGDVEDDSIAKSDPKADISQHSFFRRNLVHFSHYFPNYLKIVQQEKGTVRKKRVSLWVEYEAARKENDQKRVYIEEQLKVLHPPDDESRRELESIDIRPKNTEQATEVFYGHADSPPQSGRRGRRHGDLVTTEAEFQEILKSLENEQNEDPLKKAERVAATIPDLILDPVEKNDFKFMDLNNIVHDKEAWTQRLATDFMDNFSEKEHEMFCDAFCRFPKRFGQISRFMGGIRGAEECVIHYYMTKKAVNYKFLVSQFKKKSSKKANRRKSKAKATTGVSSETPPPVAVDTNDNLEVEVNVAGDSETVDEETDSGKKRKHESTAIISNSVEETNVDSESQPKKKLKPSKEVETSTFVEPVPVPASTVTVTPNEAPEQVAKPEFQVDASAVIIPNTAELSNGHALGTLDEKKKHISSYWSITEVNEFPALLKVYGSRWSSIAEKLATKTATMVRNYYQRNGNKHGWEDLVQAADYRLAQSSQSGDEDKYSNVDTTIVVKPQKSSQADAPKTEIHVYDTIDEHAKSALQAQNPALGPTLGQAQPIAAPMGTFQHTTPRIPGHVGDPGEFPVKRLNVNDIISSNRLDQPVYPTHTTTINGVVPLRSIAPANVKESQKSSVMSLLNNESTTVKSEPGVPSIQSKPSNLASLLNAPSSPAPQKPEPPRQETRSSNISSLLAD